MSQQAPPENPEISRQVVPPSGFARIRIGEAKKAITGVGTFLPVNSLVWAVMYAVFTVLITILVAALVLLPILFFGEDRPASAKGYLDAITWGWLALNGVPPKLGSATITLIPWGLAAIPWALMFRASKSYAARNPLTVRWHVIGGSVMLIIYVSSVVAAAHFTTSLSVSFAELWALVVSIAIGATAITIGILSGAHAHLSQRIPLLVLFVARRGAGAALAFLGVASIALAIRMLVNFGSAKDLFMGLDPGWSGILGLGALTLGYLPVMIVWSASYMLGAGFSIGPDVNVSPFISVTAPTQLPPFPPLIAIPETAGALVWLLPVVVVAIGLLWGVGISRSLKKESVLIRMVLGFAIALVGAVIMYFVSLLSLGNLGDVRLVGLGPDPLLVASLFWILLSVGITPAAVLPEKAFTRNRESKISSVPQPEEVGSQ